MLAAVHGALARSRRIMMSPRFVLIVMSRTPERGSPLAGGVPTSLRFGFGAWEAAGEALGLGFGFHVQCVGRADVAPLGAAAGVCFFPLPDVATSQITRASTTTTAATAPMTAPRLRRRLAAAARSAISRSSRARAAARWRSLVGLTVLYLPDLGCGQDFADGEADGVGDAEVAGPTASDWMVISFFGWPPAPSSLANAPSSPAVATWL